VGAAVFELNLPNFLTVFRILLVPVLVAALLSEGPEGDLLAATVFAVASFTDALDGWIARRNKSESTFGELMDPLADSSRWSRATSSPRASGASSRRSPRSRW
jgi:CDP-diacylglycerol---glycerol-3-phosphate 3-phosphatidyltransferase